MYTTLLAASLLATSQPHLAVTMESMVQAGVLDARIETVIHATPERFSATNTSAVSQLFLFGTDTGEHVQYVAVPPGAELTYDFPSGSMIGMAFEVLALEPYAKSSGPISLLTYRDEGYSAAWVTTESHGASFWLTQPEDLRLIPTTSLLPAGTSAALRPSPSANLAPLMLAPIFPNPSHVPVITPSDKPTDDSPPVLEDDPLPPV